LAKKQDLHMHTTYIANDTCIHHSALINNKSHRSTRQSGQL